VDQLLVIAPNDAWVMSGWQKTQLAADPAHNKDLIFASDLETKLAAQIGWTAQGDPSRNGRFALIVDHGKVTYAGFESEDLQNVGVSGGKYLLFKTTLDYHTDDDVFPVDAVLKAL
jgi:alkyl hydroperoxide reductase 1